MSYLNGMTPSLVAFDEATGARQGVAVGSDDTMATEVHEMAREADGVKAPVQVQVQAVRLDNGGGWAPSIGASVSMSGTLIGVSDDDGVRVYTVVPDAVWY